MITPMRRAPAVILVTTATAVALAASVLTAFAASGQVAPGTVTRPVLTAAEAQRFSPAAYFASSGRYDSPTPDRWRPSGIKLHGVTPDFVVSATPGAAGANATAAGTYDTVQKAVNAAITAGGDARRYIEVRPGTYTGTVFVPAGGPPLTIYGRGRVEDVRLQLTVDATITPAQWAQVVNPSGQYVEGDPAWPMYASCATKTTATAALCATVVWSAATDFQLRDLTITNTLLDTVDKGTHQALALRTDGDRTQLESVRLIGRQDTFYANAGDPDRIARVSVLESYIEGDTDFVFGRATAVFERCQFELVSSRKPANGVIFAPNTAPAWPYGFLVTRSRLNADEGYVAAPTGRLGRAWDQGASATGYLPGITANGQLVIRDSHLGAGFNVVAPWAPAATTSRPFVGSIEPGRTLDDPNANRLWEYHNMGVGATAPAA
jgi:pectinesterase